MCMEIKSRLWLKWDTKKLSPHTHSVAETPKAIISAVSLLYLEDFHLTDLYYSNDKYFCMARFQTIYVFADYTEFRTPRDLT